MKAKRRIIITSLSVCLAFAVAMIGVLAYTTETFSIGSRITFTANGGGGATSSNVLAYVSIVVQNAYEEVDSATITYDSDSSSETQTPELDDQTFQGEGNGNCIIYTISVRNDNTEDDLVFSLSSTAVSALKTLNEGEVVQVDVEYWLDIGNYEENESALHHEFSLDESSFSLTIPVKGTYTQTGYIEIKYTLLDIEEDADEEITLDFTLESV